VSSRTVTIPLEDGSLTRHTLGEPGNYDRPTQPLRSRRAFAAAHVVADPLAENTPTSGAQVDWEATLAFRTLPSVGWVSTGLRPRS
jgi:hypothetical protein